LDYLLLSKVQNASKQFLKQKYLGTSIRLIRPQVRLVLQFNRLLTQGRELSSPFHSTKVKSRDSFEEAFLLGVLRLKITLVQA